MKKFVISVVSFVAIVYLTIVGVNYLIDPANLFHESVVGEMVEKLSEGNIIESPGDVDEGQFVEKLVMSLDDAPNLLILGSSRIMYLPWEEVSDDPFIGGLSGSYLGDYYEVIGIFESCVGLPENLVIGVDPWAFYTDALSGRHTSIAEYAKYEKELVDNGSTNIDPDISSNDEKKFRELFTFAYFQSSVKKVYTTMRTQGLSALVAMGDKTVTIAADETIGDISKIMPNGRRIMAKEDFFSVKENDDSVDSMIQQQAIYQLGSGFSELDYPKLQEFEDLIIYLQDKGVNVEFYLPSWYPSLYDHFCENPNYGGIIKLEDYLRDFAAERSITVHGSYDPYVCDIHKEDYADWLHLKAEKMLYNYQFIKE